MQTTPKPADYSLSRLIENLANPNSTECAEIRHSRSIEAQVGRPARQNGAFIPLRPVASGLDTISDAAGQYTTQTDVAADIVTALRAESVLSRAGARTFSGLKYGFSVPIQTGGTSAAWMAENSGADAADVDPSFGVVNFAPRTLIASTSATRELIGQASPDLEAFLRADFGRTLAAAVDLAGLDGVGTSNQPLGVLRVPGISDNPLGADGGTLSAVNVVTLEEKVGIANATPTAWIAHPLLRSKLRKTPRFASGTAEPIWTDQNQILGAPAFATTAMPSAVTKGSSTDCTTLLVGDFSNLIVAMWALEILVDPYAKKKTGKIEISLYATCDIGVLRPSTFAVTADARP